MPLKQSWISMFTDFFLVDSINCVIKIGNNFVILGTVNIEYLIQQKGITRRLFVILNIFFLGHYAVINDCNFKY